MPPTTRELEEIRRKDPAETRLGATEKREASVPDCDDFDLQNIVAYYLYDASLNNDERCRAVDHLSGCPDCQEFAKDVRHAMDTPLHLLPQPPPGARERLVETLRRLIQGA